MVISAYFGAFSKGQGSEWVDLWGRVGVIKI